MSLMHTTPMKTDDQTTALMRNPFPAWLRFEKLKDATNCEKSVSAYGASHATRGLGQWRKTVFFRCKSAEDAKKIARAYPTHESLGWETTEEERAAVSDPSPSVESNLRAILALCDAPHFTPDRKYRIAELAVEAIALLPK